MSIGGILTAMVTPFDANGDVDEDATVRLMRYLLENGSDGLVVAGSTGEAATLTDEEKARLWELAVSETPTRRAFIVAGTGTYDTRHTVELTERAHEAGVDAMLVVTPYYVKPNRRGLHAHYEAAAGATGPADHPLQHPGEPDGARHAERPARRAGRDRQRPGGQAGALRGPRADRRPRPARRQRRRAGARARHGRDRWDPGRLAPGRARDAPDDRRARRARRAARLVAGPLRGAHRHDQPDPDQGGAQPRRPLRSAACDCRSSKRTSRRRRRSAPPLERHNLLAAV